MEKKIEREELNVWEREVSTPLREKKNILEDN